MLERILGEGSSFFALDIGATAIRVIELSKNSNGWKYERHSIVPIDPNLAKNQDTVLKCIEKAIDEARIKTKNVAISLSNNISLLKIAEMEKLPEAKLAEAIKARMKRLESRQGEQNYQCLTLGKSESDKEKIRVLISSVDKKLIDDRIKVLGTIGLKVIIAEPEPMALIRSTINDNKAQLVINLKDFETDYVLSYKKVPFLAKTVPFGAGLLVGTLQQNMNIDTATAQKYVADYGINPSIMNGQIAEALSTVIRQFLDEISNIISNFERKYPDLKVQKIILTGYGVVIPHFIEVITEQTKLTVGAADLWRDISISDKTKSELSAVSPHFAVAIGLAKREEGI